MLIILIFNNIFVLHQYDQIRVTIYKIQKKKKKNYPQKNQNKKKTQKFITCFLIVFSIIFTLPKSETKFLM